MRTRTRKAPGQTGTGERIRNTAFDVFARRGFDGTSLREISEAAGVNSAAVNYHWRSKEELWGAMFEEVARRILAVIAHRFDHEKPRPEALLEVLGALFDAMAEDPRAVRIVAWAMLQADSMDFQHLSQAFTPAVRLLVDSVKAMQRRGEIDAAVDVETAISTLFGQFLYVLVNSAGQRFVWGQDLSDLAYRARMKAQLLRATRLVLGLDGGGGAAARR
jgi:AcrR family transcriptional regulator